MLLSLFAAVAVLATPLQHYINLSRFQHYAFAVGTVGVGFLLQSVLSWRYISWPGRLALGSCFIYLGAFSWICYSNPWLDWNFDLQTNLQAEQRHGFAFAFAIAGLPIGYFWSLWAVDKQRKAHRAARREHMKEQDESTDVQDGVSS